MEENGRAHGPQGNDFEYDEAHDALVGNDDDHLPKAIVVQSGDYEYDEAHDALSGPLGETPTPHHVERAPQMNLHPGGDYGYDEAHDFGA